MLQEQDERDWQAGILASPMGARERTALKKLAETGIGQKIHFRDFSLGGGDTTDRLKLRGYVDWDFQPRHPDRPQSFWITDAGLEAWQEVAHLPTMAPRKKTEKKSPVSPHRRNVKAWL
jgi:hypothetical protein